MKSTAGTKTISKLSGRARQRGGAIKSIFFFFLGLAVLASIALGAGGYVAYREATRIGPLEAEAVVLFSPGANVGGIAEQLHYENAIRNPQLFKAAVRVRQVDNKLKAGEYAIPAGASVMEIIDLLIEGKSILHYLTAPEGMTTAQILATIAADETLTDEITLTPDEGVMLPETYAFTRGETRDQIIQRMMKAQTTAIDKLWPDRATELPFSTKAEAIILASIVEKETAIAEERTRIASVFVNRLKRNIRLQSDPTIIYGLTGGEPLGRGLRQSELVGKTPYNTYVIDGLPPTPIANPGLASIEAVLNPAETDDLFFVADGSGGHAFAATLAEHQRNVARWRKFESDNK